MSGRIEREKDCVAKMVGIYCHDMHRTRGDLCEGCRKLLDYADVRIDKCVFGARKSTCAKCAIHCYKKDMRAKIQEVMRHAGPKIAYEPPVFSLMLIFWNGFKEGGEREMICYFLLRKRKLTKENGT